MILTKTIIYAASRDAAERDRRDRNIEVMDEKADTAYRAEFARLVAFIGGNEAWIDLPDK